MKHVLLNLYSLLSALCSFAQLDEWQEGYLDLHHINTGRGSCMFAVLPDGTTMMVDAGELSPLDERTYTPRNATLKPDSTKKPFEWIAYYISNVYPKNNIQKIDYAVITHFHDDHFGAWYPSAPLSKTGGYRLTGITGIGDEMKIGTLLDRGYPEYDYPVSLKNNAKKAAGGELEFDSTMTNYFRFIEVKEKNGMKAAQMKAGSNTQIRLLHDPKRYPHFSVRNVKVNNLVWNGKDSTAKNIFANDFRPDENSLSIALTLQYGPFTYYTGGDNPGNVFPGDHPNRDVESKIADVVGEVDVATMDHHGNRDAINEKMIRTLRPSVWIGQTWSADHPGHEVLIRLTSKYTNPVQSDLYATNMLDANRHVIGPLIDRAYKSQQGHVVVRVMPGGEKYFVIVLHDNDASLKIKHVFGPYTTKIKH
jgi:hypothetical protein